MPSSKKSSKKSARSNKMQSFEVCKEPNPFLTFYPTEQTVYWTFLLIVIFVLALWVLNIQINTSHTIDSLIALGN